MDRRESRGFGDRGKVRPGDSGFGAVLLLVVLTYALVSLLDGGGWGAVLVVAVTSATSLASLLTAGASRTAMKVALAASLLAIVVTAIAAANGGRAWLELGSAIEIGLLAVAMLAVLRRVLTSPKIGFGTILGALSFYAVLGILFSFLYSTIDRFEPGPFFAAVEHANSGDFIFFSYTTLTTTGYGDLVPAGQPGRMLAGLEMMLGQIFLVTMVAGLVSLWRPGEVLRRHQRGSAASEPERD